MQEVMTHLCTGDQPALPKSAVSAGASSLLNTMGVEDVMGDAPKAADWVSIRSIACPSVSFCQACLLGLTHSLQKVMKGLLLGV